MSIQITDAQESQEQELLAFYRRAYRPDHPLANEKFFHWWLRDNPYFVKKGFSAKLAMDGNMIAGHYGYTPVGLWMHGKVRRAFWAGNLVVDEAYRRQGIGGMLIAALREEGDVGLDLGASPIAEPMLAKDGWTHMGTLHRWVGILDADRAGEIAADPSIVEACALREMPRATQDSRYEMREIQRFGAEHDVFWHQRRVAIACATDREAKYLNWRYADHPVFRYKMYELRAGGMVEGYAIMREEKAQGTAVPMSIMRVVEFLATAGFEEPLFLYLAHGARRHDAVLMDFFCAGADFGAVFEKYGFRREPWSDKIARLFSPVVMSKWPISFNGVVVGIPAVGGDEDGGGSSSRRSRSLTVGVRPDTLPQGAGSGSYVVLTDSSQDLTIPPQEEWYATTGDGDQDRPNTVV